MHQGTIVYPSWRTPTVAAIRSDARWRRAERAAPPAIAVSEVGGTSWLLAPFTEAPGRGEVGDYHRRPCRHGDCVVLLGALVVFDAQAERFTAGLTPLQFSGEVEGDLREEQATGCAPCPSAGSSVRANDMPLIAADNWSVGAAGWV